MTTAAAAYHWVSELCNRAPYSMLEDRIQHDETKIFSMAFFTQGIRYSDSHLFRDTHHLISTYEPSLCMCIL